MNEIKAGAILEINHSRKGKFIGKLKSNFNEDNDDFIDVELISNYVEGMNNYWISGESIPCRKSLCSYKIKDLP